MYDNLYQPANRTPLDDFFDPLPDSTQSELPDDLDDIMSQSGWSRIGDGCYRKQIPVVECLSAGA